MVRGNGRKEIYDTGANPYRQIERNQGIHNLDQTLPDPLQSIYSVDMIRLRPRGVAV